MAFAITALVLMSQSTRSDGGFTRRYFYSTTDSAATVVTDGYFNNAKTRLGVGDLIEVICGLGGTTKMMLLRMTATTAGSNFTVVDDVTDAGDLATVLAGTTAFTKRKMDAGTAVATAGAATLNKAAGKVTSEALTTAAAGIYTLTITSPAIKATDIVMVTVANGTNTQGTLGVSKVTPADGSVVIDVRNAHASQALNGTIVVGFEAIATA